MPNFSSTEAERWPDRLDLGLPNFEESPRLETHFQSLVRPLHLRHFEVALALQFVDLCFLEVGFTPFDLDLESKQSSCHRKSTA